MNALQHGNPIHSQSESAKSTGFGDSSGNSDPASSTSIKLEAWGDHWQGFFLVKKYKDIYIKPSLYNFDL